jgi:hypothetical protein
LEASHIKELGEDLSIAHLKFGDAASACRRRDLIVYERRHAMDDGTLVVAVQGDCRGPAPLRSLHRCSLETKGEGAGRGG